MSKYFIVENYNIAEIMRMFLEEGYCTFNDKDGETRYTFKRTKDINKIYGKAIAINNLYK